MESFADLCIDPDFAQSFTIYRSNGQWKAGVWVESVTPTEVPAVGTIYPSTDKEIQQVPEGDRVTGMVTFITNQILYETHTSIAYPAAANAGISDQILWHGDKYKIVKLLDWSDWGFYAAVGTRLTGA